jgi:hypothetical protein
MRVGVFATALIALSACTPAIAADDPLLPPPSTEALRIVEHGLTRDRGALTPQEAEQLRKAPLPAAAARELAVKSTHLLVRYHGPYVGYFGTDIDYREMLRAELAVLFMSEDPVERAAIAAYLRQPENGAALAPFRKEMNDWAALRRLGVLLRTTNPEGALSAFYRANEIKADPYIMFQLSNLYLGRGNSDIARNYAESAGQRWPNIKKVRAISLAKSGIMDLQHGVYGAWEPKLKEALALNLEIGRLDGAATTALELGDLHNVTRRENGYGRGRNAPDVLAYLKQAAELAEKSDAQWIKPRINKLIAETMELGIAPAMPGQIAKLRLDAFKATLGLGDAGDPATEARAHFDALLSISETEHAKELLDLLEQNGKTQGDPRQVFYAHQMRARLYIRSDNVEALGREVAKAGEFAHFVDDEDRHRLTWNQAVFAEKSGDVSGACLRYRLAEKGAKDLMKLEQLPRLEAKMTKLNCKEVKS